ncbi:FAST kinase domain-containing protein 3, mitochondrial-like [Halichoeres trimaculatus]|uniref:FAST kinase domain-containing protein 3, mitochondrial-like n=1 Tax=Halichoeres trimaculatus TaxID=147232 RepID=UPI003D9DFB5C
MKSIASITSSVRAACQHTSSCFPLNRGLFSNNTLDRCSRGVDLTRTLHSSHVNTAVVQQISSAPPLLLVPTLREGEGEQLSKLIQPKPTVRASTDLSPYSPYTKPQSSAGARVSIQSLFEGEVIPELCSRLADLHSNDRADGLATLLGACAEYGLEAQSALVQRLINECLELLSHRDLGVTQLCHLGEVSYALEGLKSAMLSEVLDSLDIAVEEDAVAPSEVDRVYSLLALCYDPASQQHMSVLATLHRHTQRMVHRLKARQVSEILQSLLKLRHTRAVSLVLSLSQRASRVFKSFSDNEVIKVLSALMILGQRDANLLDAMEKHLPGRMGNCDPELASTVMEYCLQMRCRSEPIFEAVAENFVCHAEKHSTPQIAKQIVAMGRLNYLPQCSSEMFKKLESILSTRFYQFQPRSLIEVLHACIHLERFPLNYMFKVFNPFFLQKLNAQNEPLDKNTLGQLTQLHLSTSLECTHYRGAKLPNSFHMRKFSSVDQAFETPMEGLFYKQVKRPLTELLGGKLFTIKVFVNSGYTVDVEICLDENGYVLPPTQWDHTTRRIALCLDGQSRFCSGTQHLLGKEATKRRHLRCMGFEVVQIPYFEFERMETNEQKIKYLHNKIFPTIFKFSH